MAKSKLKSTKRRASISIDQSTILPTNSPPPRSTRSSRLRSTDNSEGGSNSQQQLESSQASLATIDANHQMAVESVHLDSLPHANARNVLTLNSATTGGNAAKIQNVSVDVTSSENLIPLSRDLATTQGTPVLNNTENELGNANIVILTDNAALTHRATANMASNNSFAITPSTQPIPRRKSSQLNVSPLIYRSMSTTGVKQSLSRRSTIASVNAYTPMVSLSANPQGSSEEISQNMRALWRDQREVAPVSEIVPSVADPTVYGQLNPSPIITAQRSTPFSTPEALNDLYLTFVQFSSPHQFNTEVVLLLCADSEFEFINGDAEHNRYEMLKALGRIKQMFHLNYTSYTQRPERLLSREDKKKMDQWNSLHAFVSKIISH